MFLKSRVLIILSFLYLEACSSEKAQFSAGSPVETTEPSIDDDSKAVVGNDGKPKVIYVPGSYELSAAINKEYPLINAYILVDDSDSMLKMRQTLANSTSSLLRKLVGYNVHFEIYPLSFAHSYFADQTKEYFAPDKSLLNSDPFTANYTPNQAYKRVFNEMINYKLRRNVSGVENTFTINSNMTEADVDAINEVLAERIVKAEALLGDNSGKPVWEQDYIRGLRNHEMGVCLLKRILEEADPSKPSAFIVLSDENDASYAKWCSTKSENSYDLKPVAYTTGGAAAAHSFPVVKIKEAVFYYGCQGQNEWLGSMIDSSYKGVSNGAAIYTGVGTTGQTCSTAQQNRLDAILGDGTSYRTNCPAGKPFVCNVNMRSREIWNYEWPFYITAQEGGDACHDSYDHYFRSFSMEGTLYSDLFSTQFASVFGYLDSIGADYTGECMNSPRNLAPVARIEPWPIAPILTPPSPSRFWNNDPVPSAVNFAVPAKAKFDDQVLFSAIIRDANLDQGKNCPSGSYSDGTSYKQIAQAFGSNGGVFSVCDTDYAPALDALSKFVVSVTARSYNFPLKPGTIIESLVIVRNGQEIVPVVNKDVKIKGGRVVFSDSFVIEDNDKIKMEVKEIKK